MGKLEDLRKTVEELFNQATDKQSIDNLSKIKTQIDEAKKEVDEVSKERDDLLKSYKEAVKHTIIGSPAKAEASNPAQPKPVTFESALDEFLKKKEK